jgi:putative permease
MEPRQHDPLLATLMKAAAFAAALVVLLWLLLRMEAAVLLGLLAVILAMVLNPVVTRLEARGVRRGLGTAVVALGLLVGGAALAWLVVPRLAAEVPALIDELPDLLDRLADRLTEFMGGHPEVARQLEAVNAWIMEAVEGLWRHADALAGFFLFSLFLVALVLYVLVDPRPLVSGYLRALAPRHRDPAARALARSSRMVVGWMLANVIIGAIKATASVVFLLAMGVPGAVLWSFLTFFSQLIPRIGFYIMSTPPVLVALSMDPLTAVWVALFYWGISELLGNFVAPKVQSATMDLHPAYLLFMTLAMAVAFGVVGVLISVPVAGILKAHLDEFHMRGQPGGEEVERGVEWVMRGKVAAPDA